MQTHKRQNKVYRIYNQKRTILKKIDYIFVVILKKMSSASDDSMIIECDFTIPQLKCVQTNIQNWNKKALQDR